MGVRESADRPAGYGGQTATLAICVLLAALVFAVFGQTLRFGFVEFDDGDYFFSNPHVKGGLTGAGVTWAFQTLHSSNWHPLTWLSLMLDATLFGPGPAGPHFTNVLLHATNAVLLFLLLKRLTSRRSPRGAASRAAEGLWPSAFVAAVFALHPLRVESVAWISERKDVLSGLFFLLTLWMYARYVERAEAQSPRWKGSYLCALALFALGLMSKPMLVTVPFVLVLLDAWPLRRVGRAPLSRLALEKLPFLVLSAGSCAVTLVAQQATVVPVPWLPWSIRIENALTACVAYLGQMLYPARLSVLYPYPAAGITGWEVALSAMLLAGISVWVIRARSRRPYLLTGWFWYLAMLAPVIGLIQVGYQSRADRYTYLTQIGLYVALAWLIWDLSTGWRNRRALLATGAIAVLAALGARASMQTACWRSNLPLWENAVAQTAFNPVALANLDVALGDRLDPERGIEDFKRILAVMPNYAEAHYSLGTLLYRLNRLDQAAGHLRRAIEIAPRYTLAHNNLANVELAQRNLGRRGNRV